MHVNSSRLFRHELLLLVLLGASWEQAQADTLMFQQGDGGAFSTTDATYLSGTAPTANFGSNTTLFAETDSSAPAFTRILIRFPDLFGPNAGQIPFGSTINSATLTLRTLATSNSQSPNLHSVFRVLTDWDENTVTWNGFNSGGVAGIDYVAAPLATFTPATVDTSFPISVTAAVQAWSDGTANRGLFVINPGNNQTRFNSDDSATAAARPRLTVDFTAAAPEAIPEPASLTLLGLGALGLAGYGWKRRGR